MSDVRCQTLISSAQPYHPSQDRPQTGRDPAQFEAKIQPNPLGPFAVYSGDARAFTPEKAMHDARYALRSLRRQPGFTALALVTLALGIGATTTAFAVLDTVLLRPLPYANPDRLILLREKTKTGALQVASYPNFSDWRDRARSFSGLVSAQFPQARTVVVGSNVSRVIAVGVSRGFFAVLGAPPAVGREFSADENRAGGAPAVMV